MTGWTTRVAGRALVLLLAGAPAATAQGDAGASERFRREAPEHWRRYEAFAVSLQGEIHRRAALNFPGRRVDDAPGETRSRVKQNPRCALVGGQLFRRNKEAADQQFFFANPNYSAVVRRKDSEPDSSLLQAWQPDPNAVMRPAPAPVRDWAFLALSPHFSFHGLRLSQCLNDARHHFPAVAGEQRGGRELVRVEFDAKLGTEKQPLSSKGILFFDPARSWCLVEVREHLERDANDRSETTLTYEVADDPAGFPIIRHETRITESNSREFGKGKTVFEIDYDVTVDDRVRDDEFTLTAFGLPEPLLGAPPKQTPNWVWFLLAAGGCAVVAMACRYGANRWLAAR